MTNLAARCVRRSALPLLLLLLVVASASRPPAALARPEAAPAQRREHLTEQEVEMVRDTQELDRRVALFVKIAERRVVAATAATTAPATSAKESEKWGELPKGTRTQLFKDLARVLDEAINNIDDVGARSPNNSLIPKAVKHLAAAAARFLPQLTPLRAGAEEEDEREALEQVIESLQQVLDAAKQMPAEASDKKDQKKP